MLSCSPPVRIMKINVIDFYLNINITKRTCLVVMSWVRAYHVWFVNCALKKSKLESEKKKNQNFEAP